MLHQLAAETWHLKGPTLDGNKSLQYSVHVLKRWPLILEYQMGDVRCPHLQDFSV